MVRPSCRQPSRGDPEGHLAMVTASSLRDEGGLANRPSRRATTNPERGLRPAERSLAQHLPADTCNTDSGLAAVMAAWPELPSSIRAGIVALVKAAHGGF